DAERVLAELEERAIVPANELVVLKRTVYQIIQHLELKKQFDGTDKVFNERSILTKDGLVLRPDRINISPENVSTLIDYKTGSPKIWHANQLIDYANALQDMGFTVSEKILIYSNEDEIVINKV
ncbi:MAG TPA: DNA helicase UvrD, partial [Aequorivita sp.]|nr:DNA helicase UvrD [Aequorivita sp.]